MARPFVALEAHQGRSTHSSSTAGYGYFFQSVTRRGRDLRGDKMISAYEYLSTWLRAHVTDSERGASLVEYALLVALIAVVCVLAIQILGENSSKSFSSTGSGLAGAN